MELLNRAVTGRRERPVKILQFGEGAFLRGFVDHMIDIANEKGYFDGDIVMIKPREGGSLEGMRRQECLYTVSLRGIVNGRAAVEDRIVTSVADVAAAHGEYEKYSAYAKLDSLRFIVSNTTEAGIVYDPKDRLEMTPPKSFPGKLTKFLYERFRHFDGDMEKGLIMLPTELIDNNGPALEECVRKHADSWGLEEGFRAWLDEACVFCSTLVDRIITGYPESEAPKLWERWGYEDHYIVTGEPFALWVIESRTDIQKELPLKQAGLPVIFTEDQKPYRERKVAILNGAHTAGSLVSYLCGNDYVLQSMEDEPVYEFIYRTVYEEVLPTLTLPREELELFAEAVLTRFRNPYVRHALLSIALNSVSKWRSRCLPALLAGLERTGRLPARLTFSLAALMAFYTGSTMRGRVLTGRRGDEEYGISDDAAVLAFFAENSGRETKEFVDAYLSRRDFHGRDLTQVEGLADQTAAYLADIRALGMRSALHKNFG